MLPDRLLTPLHTSNNFHFHIKDTLIFNYNPGDVLSITETETCIVHLYSMDGMMDQDVAQCNTESGHGAGTASDCWTWVADYVDTQTCQDSINSIMDQVSRHRSVFTCSCASNRPPPVTADQPDVLPWRWVRRLSVRVQRAVRSALDACVGAMPYAYRLPDPSFQDILG